MKFLQFIKEITDSDEEFLAVIQEMNTWKGEDNEEKNKSLYVPNYHGRLNFTREEHRNALERAITGCKKCEERTRMFKLSPTKALRQRKTNIEIINQFALATRREKTLSIHHCFGRRMINIPSISSAEKLLRNNQIFSLYKLGKNYQEISQHFGISERWIRTIINTRYS